MRPLTTTVNMNHAALSAWLRDPRHLLASTETGLASLRRLVAGDHYHDADFARTVDNFNTRHGLQGHTFGQEAMQSGWSKRHIALKNWGHDPSSPDSPLYGADASWKQIHAGAGKRRNTRVPNPQVVSSISAPPMNAEKMADFSRFILGHRSKPRLSGERHQITLVPEGQRLPGMVTEVPLGPYMVGVGVLRSQEAPNAASRSFAADKVNRLLSMPYSEHTPGLLHLAPALEHSIAMAHDRDRRPVYGREPNPPISAWIMPVAQFIVSLGGLVYSGATLVDVFGGKPAPEEG